jgi:hypothetical protein
MGQITHQGLHEANEQNGFVHLAIRADFTPTRGRPIDRLRISLQQEM